MINEAVLQDVREKLERRAAALNSMQFAGVIQKDFSFKKIRAGLGKKEISDWICASLGEDFSHAAIYRLTVDNAAGAGRLRSAFADYNPQNGHVQTRNNNVDDSNTIYVGSSRKIAQRLRQHLFNCPPSTYALKMHLWAPRFLTILAGAQRCVWREAGGKQSVGVPVPRDGHGTAPFTPCFSGLVT